MTMVLLRLGIIVFGAAFIISVGSLLWFGLNAQRDPASFPTSVAIAPDFSALGAGEALPGFEALSDVEGVRAKADGPFVVNFFASWCQPCRLEHPFLLEFNAANPDVLIGMAYRDEPLNAAQYLTTDRNPYAAVVADTDSLNALNFGLTGVPETYLFAADGTLLFRSPGPLIGALRSQFLDAWEQATR